LVEKIHAQACGSLPGRLPTNVMEELFYLSLVTASISFTVTETKLLNPLRERVKRKSALLGELFSCGYCFGHWAALALVVIYRPRLFDLWWPLDYFLTTLMIAWLAAFQWVLMCRLMQKVGK
jgi:hypothetical protein